MNHGRHIGAARGFIAKVNLSAFCFSPRRVGDPQTFRRGAWTRDACCGRQRHHAATGKESERFGVSRGGGESWMGDVYPFFELSIALMILLTERPFSLIFAELNHL